MLPTCSIGSQRGCGAGETARHCAAWERDEPQPDGARRAYGPGEDRALDWEDIERHADDREERAQYMA